MNNKRGQMTMFLFFIIVALLCVAIGLFILGLISIKVNQALDQNIDIGQVNLQTLNSQTFGVLTTTFLNNADWWGTSIIFGMILGLLVSAYFLRGTYSKFGIIFDIFLIFGAFILSLYISCTYQTIIDAFSSAGEPFLETYIPKTSTFILNLPIYTIIIGVISMILFHSSIPRKAEERYQSGGYLQGI